MTKPKTGAQNTAKYTQKKLDKKWVRVYAWAKNTHDRSLVVAYANKLIKKED